MKLKRYDMETLGGGHDYSWKEDEYGGWCRDDDVEALEREREALTVTLRTVGRSLCDAMEAIQPALDAQQEVD